jgi:hypothetical protein
MAGLNDLFMQIAAKKRSAPYDPRADELSRLQQFGGIPEGQNQPDPSNPQANPWYRDYVNRMGQTPYHATPNYPSPAYPWTQISPKIGSHSNMPTYSPDQLRGGELQAAGQPAFGGNYSYDELGRRYPAITLDDLLSQPNSSKMTDAIYRMLGMSPDLPGLQMFDAMRGGG